MTDNESGTTRVIKVSGGEIIGAALRGEIN
jgi:hypothetical protein